MPAKKTEKITLKFPIFPKFNTRLNFLASFIVIGFSFAVFVSLLGGLGRDYVLTIPPPPPPPGSSVASSQDKIDSRIFQVLSSQDKVGVIINLKDPGAVDKEIEGYAKDIQIIQSRILTLLDEDEFEIVYRYKALPGLAGKIAESGIEKIARHPQVVEVYFDEKLNSI